jgi:hypothetical protein
MKKPTSFVVAGALGLSFVLGALARDFLTTQCFAQPTIEAPPTKTAPVKGVDKGTEKMEKEPFKQKQEIGRFQLSLSTDRLYLLDTTNGRCWARAINANQNEGWTEISPFWAVPPSPAPPVPGDKKF